MKSPFARIDPCIESGRLWDDVHAILITEIQATIAKVLPPAYVARTGERPYVVLASTAELEPVSHTMQADVGVTIPAEAADAAVAGALLDHGALPARRL